MAEIQLKDDCLIEILSRLPVKSLIRFTCVSKAWLSLIRSPEFATKHYSTQLNYHNSHQCLLALFTVGCSISLFSSQNHDHHLAFQTAFEFRPAVAYHPFRFEVYHRDIVDVSSIFGPCNGLFLISLGKRYTYTHLLLLWNPATRELFKLPPLFNDNNHLTYCCYYGFGFDSVNHDYKVVGLYDFIDGVIDTTVVWLYCLATNSWRRLHHAYDYIQFEPGMRVSSNRGSSSNGCMHNWFLSHCYPSQITRSLLSFDMVDEVFVETPLPPDAPSPPHGFMNHGSNHPYVYTFGNNSDLHISIWVLQGYGPTGVWSKLLNISLPKLRPTSYAVLWNNNEIVFSPHGTITLLNLTSKQMKSRGKPADANLLAYTESLVPIAKCVRQPPNTDHSSV